MCSVPNFSPVSSEDMFHDFEKGNTQGRFSNAFYGRFSLLPNVVICVTRTVFTLTSFTRSHLYGRDVIISPVKHIIA